MKATFIDTSYLLALSLTDDAHHAGAKAWQNVMRGPLVTTEYVLIEFLDALSSPRLRGLAARIIEIVRTAGEIHVEPASTLLLDEGFVMFRKYSDKGWSMTDCISFCIMHRQEIVDALSSDRDFEQAGFRALLRHAPQDRL